MYELVLTPPAIRAIQNQLPEHAPVAGRGLLGQQEAESLGQVGLLGCHGGSFGGQAGLLSWP